MLFKADKNYTTQLMLIYVAAAVQASVNGFFHLARGLSIAMFAENGGDSAPCSYQYQAGVAAGTGLFYIVAFFCLYILLPFCLLQ